MKKTQPIIRIGLGFSLSLLFGNCFRYLDGNMDKFYIRLGIAILILVVLYIKKFRVNTNFLTALKDSNPYFIALYLFGLDTWISMGLGFLLMIWDFAGDG